MKFTKRHTKHITHESFSRLVGLSHCAIKHAFVLLRKLFYIHGVSVRDTLLFHSLKMLSLLQCYLTLIALKKTLTSFLIISTSFKRRIRQKLSLEIGKWTARDSYLIFLKSQLPLDNLTKTGEWKNAELLAVQCSVVVSIGVSTVDLIFGRRNATWIEFLLFASFCGLIVLSTFFISPSNRRVWSIILHCVCGLQQGTVCRLKANHNPISVDNNFIIKTRFRQASRITNFVRFNMIEYLAFSSLIEKPLKPV